MNPPQKFEAIRLTEVRCVQCRRLLARVQARIVEVKCRECKVLTTYNKS